MSDTRVSRRRSVRTLGRSSRGASVRRVECRVLTCDPGGRIASRVPAAAHRRGDARGQRGPSEKKKYSRTVPEPGSLALGLSRAPIARARSRRARHRRAHAVQTTHSRDLRAQIHPGEAYRTVAPKRARSLTSGGAPGQRGRARGRAENTERREICREPVGSETRRTFPRRTLNWPPRGSPAAVRLPPYRRDPTRRFPPRLETLLPAPCVLC